MMNMVFSLMVRTLQDPRRVAQELSALRIARTHLWSALFLAVVLNALTFQLALLTAPATGPIPPLLSSPLMFAAALIFVLVLTIASLYQVGRFLGGTGSFDAIMTAMIWLQFLRLFVQVAALLLGPVMPGLVGILVLGASLYGIWIVLNFVDVIHDLKSRLTAFGVLVMSLLVIMIGMAIALSFFGINNLRITPYV